jgi:hypothetical protein
LGVPLQNNDFGFQDNMSRKWRSQLATILIEGANKFPLLQGDVTEALRHIKKSQDEDSKDALLKSRPPKGVEIEYIYFRLFDTFQIEDVEDLLSGLRKLFPNFNDPFLRGDYYEKFIRNATGITAGGWINLGYICRDRKGRYFGDKLRELKNLPPYIDYIHIELHKVLPSVFAITYDVNLEESITQQLIALQNSPYKSEIRFRKLIPYGKVGGGYSINSAERVMREEITNWFSSIRYEVERHLREFLVGDFLRDKSSKNARLPSVEVFSITGIPKTKPAIRNWIEKSSGWLDSLGFNLLYPNPFTDGKLIFVPNWKQDDDNNISHRIIISRDAYINSINLKAYGGDEKTAINYNTQEGFLSSVLPLLVVLEMLARFQEKFEKIRRDVLKTIKPPLIYGVYFGKYIKLGDTVLQASVLQDRISKDFRFEVKYISSKLREISSFSEIGRIQKTKYQKLDKDLLGRIEFRVNLLKEHVDFAMTWLSQYLALRNISVTYFLALVAGIAAIISLLLSLKK